jgi:hypothetical protein
MPEITVTTTVTFDPEKFYSMAAFAWSDVYVTELGPAPGPVGGEPIGLRVVTLDNPDLGAETGTTEHIVTWQQLGDAIAHIAAGTFTDHDGVTEKQPADYHVVAAVAMIHNFEDADWDSETEDLILQQAVFGKVIYG